MESQSEHDAKQRGATSEIRPKGERAANEPKASENEPQSEHGTKYRGATNEPKASEKASELPPELWLAIMRLLDSMRDHHAFALTCAFFASLARAEVERSKLRLARYEEWEETRYWNDEISWKCAVVGTRLANGKGHGRCYAQCGRTVVGYEMRDGLRQGEARLWGAPGFTSWAMRTLYCGARVGLILLERCYYVDDKLEGQDHYFEQSRRKNGFPIEEGCALLHEGRRYQDGSDESGELLEHYYGHIMSRQYWEDNQLQGWLSSYRLDGGLHRCYHREHGRKEGWHFLYHDNGQLKLLCWFESGKKEGLQLSWRWSGQLACVHTFREGNLYGQSLYWNEEGEALSLYWSPIQVHYPGCYAP